MLHLLVECGCRFSNDLEHGLSARELTVSVKRNEAYASRVASRLLQCIQCKIQRQHVHTGFSENPKLTSFRMLRDKLANHSFFHPAGARYSSHLVSRRRGTDMRIETAP